MSLPLDNKVAVVTGASRGIGLYVARSLAEKGMSVAMLARSADLLKEEADRIGDRALAVPVDLTDPNSVREAFAQVTDRFGGVDMLVNNAALTHLAKIDEVKDDELMKDVGTNLCGPIYCIREAVPSMRARGGGTIVNISSETVMRAYPYLTIYATTKQALEGLSFALREELRGDKIRVTVLRSGVVDSGGGFGSHWDPDVAAKFGQECEAEGLVKYGGVAIDPQITADTVVYLAMLPAEANIDDLVLRAI